ncbi:MAG: mycothiol synthase [Acidimicrobiales bacterium]|nr:mycothiol synthase [Acidimicrobiales bacterium]
MVELRLVADAAARGPARYVPVAPADAPAIDAAAATLGATSTAGWSTVEHRTLDGVVALGQALGADAVEVAIEPADDATDAALAACRARRIRTIRQLRRALPVPPEPDAIVPGSTPTEVTLRSFCPGTDDEADWLRVNARAFAWHPEQGFVDADDLAGMLRAPWFDAEGFVVATRAGDLVGFCWTKVHGGGTTAMGEIYAIGVDPDAQGIGLGRRLVLAGLDHLDSLGVSTAMLWVEADNTAALHLYDALGFVPHHDKRYYLRPVAS